MKKVRRKNGIFSWISSASGTGAIAGAHNVCHALCQGLVLFLALFGIAVSSTALMFLEDYAPYLWSMGIFFLAVSAYFLIAKRQGSQKLLLANTGILLAGIPFRQFQGFSGFFLAAGAAMITLSVFLYLSERFLRNSSKRNFLGKSSIKKGERR